MTAALGIHIAIGTVALLLYWVLLVTRKGSHLHRRLGTACLLLLVVTGLSVGPVLISGATAFDPGQVVQTVYLTLCLAVVSAIAVGAIRYRDDPGCFRRRLCRWAGPILLLFGLAVLLAGLRRGDPVAVVVSWVGLAYGGGMVAFDRYRGPLHPRWWMGWHLHATTGLFNAVNGTVLYVAARSIGLLPEGAGSQAWCQAATLLGAIALRLWFARTHRAPLRFGPRAERGRDERRPTPRFPLA